MTTTLVLPGQIAEQISVSSRLTHESAAVILARRVQAGAERVNDFAPLVVTSLLSRSVSVGS
jgi:hypothetical protein